MRGRYVALCVFALGTGLAGGVASERFYFSMSSRSDAGADRPLYWVAPMDPNFRKDGPGQSPMGMDLVPVYAGGEPGDPSEVKLSAAEINAIGVRTAVARVEEISQRIETVGFVTYDEHATSHIHMRVEGWIEDLKARAVGERVSKGDLLFELYAPEIAVVSADLQQGVRSGSRSQIENAELQLRNFGVSPQQIKEMRRAGEPVQRMQVHAPQDGIVIALAGAEGRHLTAETLAMSLTDLSTVWLVIDVFERDIARLSPDMNATARFEHLPGRVFEGGIDYIYPELDAETRTLPVRLKFDNTEGLLKPNMFGTVALTPAESREALTVPTEAVIRTGRAERVILKTGDGVFRPRLVTSGLRDSFAEGGRTEIVQGLEPGAEVVASAQFLIDSETALNAGLLRFAPTEDAPAPGKGTLIALDAVRRQAVIAHEPILALDWPALETRFALRADVRFDRLQIGDTVRFAAARGADGLLALTELKPDDGIDAVGTAVLHSVTEDGLLSLTHDPIPALGWPAMTMDLPVEGFNPGNAPLNEPVEIALARGEDGLFTVVGVNMASDTSDAGNAAAPLSGGQAASMGMRGLTIDFPMPEQAAKEPSPSADTRQPAPSTSSEPITVSGTFNSIDVSGRTANVTHGPIREIGMPGMTMEFAIDDGVDTSGLPLGQQLSLILKKNPDFTLTLIGVESATGQEVAQ